MTDPSVEIALDAKADLAEGPWWDTSSSELLWVDIFAGEVHRFDPLSGLDRFIIVDQPVGMVARRSQGGLVCAVRDGIGFVDFDAATISLVAPVEGDRQQNRMNDGACDAAGRLWAGTMGTDLSPKAGALYRIDSDLQATAVLSEISISNGLDWSLDGRTMYYTDSPTRQIEAFDFEPSSGALSNRRMFADVSGSAATPDGMAVDAEDALWVAMWDGGCLHRFGSDGILLQTVGLPVSRPTSVAFGGKNFDQLFITSARHGLSRGQLAEQPHAGAIFVLESDVPGRPPYEFGG
ncbi:sugar lactone lactonase YvrE [Arthrobacter pigmenti]|uniref:Sugar lactone lactonase YvrE n=1 Tax=Arthrobacter pigmenti TaxID=271432 RepID=A0A846RK49_9MICC|nr:SMP-30/gluconolactonase/LRE family protein [Arthrobacter pigmenti]NJC21519.1 sugar lactone lactonase YvrE [Arthrobacter pigmenti]